MNVVNEEGCNIWDNWLLSLIQIYVFASCQSNLFIVTCTVGTSELY